MTPITQYKTVDGKIFSTITKAVIYEQALEDQNKILSILNPVPDGTDFLNGCSFVQQEANAVRQARHDLLTLFSKFIDHKWILQTRDNLETHPSWVAWLIDEYDEYPFKQAWHRLCCIDSQFREWGQQYFANNPEKSEALKNKK